MRRGLLFAPLLAALPLALSQTEALAGKINPSETQVTPPDAIKWSGWINGFPPRSAEMATLYGGLDRPGPYLVLMKWYPRSHQCQNLKSRAKRPAPHARLRARSSVRSLRARPRLRRGRDARRTRRHFLKVLLNGEAFATDAKTLDELCARLGSSIFASPTTG